jgi:uncharacterized lipoprotein YddW (UPF0748 family)
LGIPAPSLSAQADAIALKQSQPTATQPMATDHTAVRLGVAIAHRNDTLQSAISNRLNRINQPFQFIDWERMNELDDLAGIHVLFLPAIRTVTSQQVRVLSAWVEQGGQIIVSGSLGASSSSTVQAQLRSLLGAYWAFPLPEPTQLRVRDRHPLADEMADSDAIEGGVIVPTGLGNQILATWQTSTEVSVQQGPSDGQISRRINVGSAGAPAIVMTDTATFLGWHWGEHDADIDAAWLQAVLSPEDRETLAQRPPIQLEESSVAPTFSNGQGLMSDEAADDAADDEMVSDSGASDPATARRSGEDSSQVEEDVNEEPVLDLFTFVRSPRSPQPDEATANDNDTDLALPLAPTSDDEFIDPTQQIAPPGIDTQPTARPIHILEKLSMTEELENLIGRFESALLASHYYSTNSDEAISAISEDDGVLVASVSNQLGTIDLVAEASEETTYARVVNHPALLEAKAILEAFPALVDERRYEEARSQWLEARRLLWENFPMDRPIAQPEVRAIWLDRGTIVEAGSRRGLAVIFDRLANAGINTVFVETVNAGYPIYPSRVAPEQNPLTRHWDPLQAAVELAHERGMEAHAWVWVFAAGNQRHNTIVNLPWSYPGPILAAHPDWANADRQGRAIPAGQDKPFLDPANPQVRQYLMRLYEEIITQYDVDGLQLDYIRYPFQNAASGRSYGYGSASRQQFQGITGVDPLTLTPNDRELWRQWTEFRTEQVNSFVADTADRLRRIRPDIVLSAAVFAMSEHERIQKLQQHWEVWAQEGDIDMIVTMSYALDTNRFQQLTSPWLLDADLGSTLVVPGIQLLNLSESAAFDQIQLIRDMPAGGYALFAAEHLNAELSTVFNQTQGTEQVPLAPVPFREPFTTASTRFQALQREWDLLLDSGAIWMRESNREELKTAAENLQAVLDDLSDDSSPRQIRQAQAEINAFISQFSDWMSLQSYSHGYRIQSWQNRLAMIDTLLSYGGDRL